MHMKMKMEPIYNMMQASTTDVVLELLKMFQLI